VHSLGHDLAVAPVSCRPASHCHPDPDAAWPRLGRRRTLRKRVTSRAGGSPRHPRGRNQGSDRSTRIVRRRRQGCGPRWYARAEGTTAWVDFMMRFELGLEQPDPKRALGRPSPDRNFTIGSNACESRDRAAGSVASGGPSSRTVGRVLLMSAHAGAE
jgi:hypothetical protein